MPKAWKLWKSSSELVERPVVDFSGKWVNDLKSYMEISVKGDRVTGTYHTRVGAPTIEEEFPLIGYVNGNLIAFIVDFGEHGSIGSFAGYFVKDSSKGKSERIYSLWHLVSNKEGAAKSKRPWDVFSTSFNIFKRNR